MRMRETNHKSHTQGLQRSTSGSARILHHLEQWLRSSDAWKNSSSSKPSAISFLMTHRSSQSRISICMWEDPRTTWRMGQTSWLVRKIASKHLDLFGYHSISYLSQCLQKWLQITQSFCTAKAINTSAACASSCTVCPRVPSWVRRAKMQQRPCLHPRHLWRNAWKSQGKGGVIPQSHAEFLGLVESCWINAVSITHVNFFVERLSLREKPPWTWLTFTSFRKVPFKIGCYVQSCS